MSLELVHRKTETRTSFSLFRKSLVRNRSLLLMIMPGVVYLFIFYYLPIYGVTIAFKDFNLSKGILGSDWVGLKHFAEAFKDNYFLLSLRNTLYISFLRIILGFPVPIIFALLLNEVRKTSYKKIVQTVSFLPHFMSWVILAGIFLELFSMNGVVNYIYQLFGHEPILFMADKSYFISMLLVTNIWKEAGWGAIIYLAALSNIDQQLYEAAYIDGASRIKQTIHITLPSLSPVIIIMLILTTGNILNAGFDQIFNMGNPRVMEVAEIIDTYVYKRGLLQMDYSYSTAVGLFKSVVAFIMIMSTNKAAKLFGEKEYSLF